MAAKKAKIENFEDEIEKLEDIVSSLEGGNITLDEAFNIFEKGVSITKKCSKMLEGYERKIMIVKNGKNRDKDGESEDDKLELFDE